MTIDEQVAYLTKGCVDVVRSVELRSKLERSQKIGRPLVVKVGFDPTAPDLHLGHTVLIRKMKHFQDLGHRVVYVVGSFTALIGDPTGRSKTRPPLTREEIDANAETYKTQIFKILDPQRTEVRFNSEWLEPLGSYGWVKLAAKYNVAQLLEGLDGVEKMSKSLGNYVGVTDPAAEMFGKLMSISDDLMWKYYALLTDLDAEDVQERRDRVSAGTLHPKAA